MIRSALLFAIGAYQRLVSPWTPASCRFHPTCSEYARVAIERHGAASGGWLALRRLGRCHPFGGKGFDPVPEVRAPGAVDLPAPTQQAPEAS